MIEGFHLGAGGNAGQVCLMHGFTGSPWDLIPVGEALAAGGFEVDCPRLPGHGFPDHPEENCWPAWLARGQACLDDAVNRADGRPVVVAGLSMGALLTLQLARANPESIAAIATFAPAVEVSNFNRFGIWLLGNLSRFGLGALEMPKGGSDAQDKEAQAENPGSNPFSFSAYRSFGELRVRTRAIVGEVRAPTLILHGALDATCPLAGSAWLEQSLGAADVERHILPRSGHVITRDLEAAEVGSRLLDFLRTRLA